MMLMIWIMIIHDIHDLNYDFAVNIIINKTHDIMIWIMQLALIICDYHFYL